MQPARTLHSQATEKSLFVLRSNTWNTLSRAVTLERGALRTQGCPVFGRTGHLMLLLPPGCVWPTFISPWSLKQGVDKGEAAVQPWRRTMLIQCTVVQHLGHRREDQGLRDSRSGVFPPIPAVSHSLEQLSDKTVCQLCERQLLRVRSGSAQA